ncbi:hypothetical protein FAP39_05915 [Shimia litoralis]|uniref:Prepilin type IV endopeptidase peptidase domain-containing protein n=1 Tax=Shimia litoralis TaxID=420403 RepID=A0A4U7NA82_9RHOB|nr:prepilin peptidase [Shimia litoralis]TKZ21634.1 hypothetical protein FAP39_05915 [Shimia litoralis]
MLMSATAALWFLPFVVPVCFYVAWSDMRAMRIPNESVLILTAIFVVIGIFLFPLPEYGWRLLQLVIVLLVGMILNASGLVGAGDAKFAAAAAPFVAIGDLHLLGALFAANLLAAWVTHRIAKHSPIRRMVPDWTSWDQGWDFPMGLALGGTLSLYLILACLYGA